MSIKKLNRMSINKLKENINYKPLTILNQQALGNINQSLVLEKPSVFSENINTPIVNIQPTLEISTVNDFITKKETIKKSSVNDKNPVTNTESIINEKIPQIKFNNKTEELSNINNGEKQVKEILDIQNLNGKPRKLGKLERTTLYTNKPVVQRFVSYNVNTESFNDMRERSIATLISENVVQENINFRR